MPAKNKVILYKETDIKTAGKLKSLLLLVDRGITLLTEAKENAGVRSGHIVKVQNILAQLEQMLNFDRGPQAGDLFFVYDYLFEELQNRDERGIETTLRMLTELRDTFKALSRKPKT
jgi:flagellin-specific chaperone FliS